MTKLQLFQQIIGLQAILIFWHDPCRQNNKNNSYVGLLIK